VGPTGATNVADADMRRHILAMTATKHTVPTTDETKTGMYR
jgi:hypothetical protein